MPHLSPMKWLLTMFILWTSQFIIKAGTWWYSTTTFNAPNNMMLTKHTSNWQWLQDGR